MTVFEYSSILIAILIGQSAVKISEKIVCVLDQPESLKLYVFELSFAVFVLLRIVIAFFYYFAKLNGLETIEPANFILGPFLAFFCIYLSAHYLPIPTVMNGTISIEKYFWNIDRLKVYCSLLGVSVIYPVVSMQFLTEEFEVFKASWEGWPVVIQGIAIIISGFYLERAITVFGIPKIKSGITIFALLGILFFVFLRSDVLSLVGS